MSESLSSDARDRPLSVHESTTVRPPLTAGGPGPLARLIAFIVSVGLAWAIVVAGGAWVLGLIFGR